MPENAEQNSETIYCNHCDAKLDPNSVVWLELRLGTDDWSIPGVLHPNNSQGVFPFGSACANRMLFEVSS